ncbi:hypothetical protein PATSB16_14900 [Pandoraea thiooxydans]|nr:hypothetical protein PATSB16_14900 [Pandoraea thiooxydans]
MICKLGNALICLRFSPVCLNPAKHLTMFRTRFAGADFGRCHQ